MKIDFFVQHSGMEIRKKDMVKMIKQSWTQEGNLIKDIQSLDMYYNADESRCYWVINNSEKGFVQV